MKLLRLTAKTMLLAMALPVPVAAPPRSGSPGPFWRRAGAPTDLSIGVSVLRACLTSASQTLTPRAAERSALTRARSEAARAASVARSSAQTIANSRSTSSRRGGRFSCCSRSTAGGSLYLLAAGERGCHAQASGLPLPVKEGNAAWRACCVASGARASPACGAVGFQAAPHHAVSDVLPQKSCLIDPHNLVLARHEPNSSLSPEAAESSFGAPRAKTSFAQIL